VLFNHIGLDLPAVFLEHIPHLRKHFVNSVRVEDGGYRPPRRTSGLPVI
jgi:L-fuconate dehydratase